MSNHVRAKVRTLPASPNSCPSMEKSVENVERQAGDVDATDLMPVCENRAKQHKHIEPLNVPSRGQMKAGEAIWE